MAMKDYPTILDFITKGDEVKLDEKTERDIIQYMEDYAFSVESNETEAYSQASMIVLNC
jgi:hypothetical protein